MKNSFLKALAKILSSLAGPLQLLTGWTQELGFRIYRGAYDDEVERWHTGISK